MSFELIREFGVPVLLMARGLATDGLGAAIDAARTLPVKRIAEAIARTFSVMKTFAALQKSGRVKVSIPRPLRQYLPLLIFCAIYFGSRPTETRRGEERPIVLAQRAYQVGFNRGFEEGRILAELELRGPPPPYGADEEDA